MSNKSNVILENVSRDELFSKLREIVRKEKEDLINLLDREVTTGEAAKILGCSRQTVRKLEKEGKLPNRGSETGHFRFKVSDINNVDWRKYQRE